MRINLSRAYTPQVGDILSWTSGKDKILFVISENKLKELRGVAIFDSRHNHHDAHTVSFKETFNYRLQLVCPHNKVWFDLDQILEDWRIENE